MTQFYLMLWILGISSTVTCAEIRHFSDDPNNPDTGSFDQVTDPFNMFPVTNNPVSGQTFPFDPLENEVNSVDGQFNPEKVEADSVTTTATTVNSAEVEINTVDGEDNSETLETNNVNVHGHENSSASQTSEEVPLKEIILDNISHLITDFGLVMSKMIHEHGEQDTVLFSPLSISTLMTLLMGGMGKQSKTYNETYELLGYNNVTETLRNIEDSLGITISDEEFIHQLYQKLLTALLTQNDKISFKMGNEIFLQQNDSKTINVLSTFTKMAKENYNAGIQNLDFYSDPIGAANIINEWVNTTTGGKIPELLTDPLSPQTKFVAANALYFKAPWKFPFSTGDTTVLTFDTGREKLDIPFMSKIINVKFLQHTFDSVKASVVELPYKGDRYSMFIIKPNEPASLESVLQLENNLSANAIDSLVSRIKSYEAFSVWVDIPRMRLRYRTYLKDILKDMGASSMFSIKDADFSRITSSNQPILDNMIHEAVMDITEEGTEAAAATSTVNNRFSTSLSFVLNQPSLLFIYDSKTKIPIFWARLVTPESI